jgi:hypothetical protein
MFLTLAGHRTAAFFVVTSNKRITFIVLGGCVSAKIPKI